jgi:enoyl-CoA hydratase/carnithine racemase
MWHHERNENPTEQERAMASVISERNGAVQRLQLNEPDSMNALSKTLATELARGVVSAVADPDVRCILLTGTGQFD